MNCFLVLNARFRIDSPSCLRSKLTAKLSLPPTPQFRTMNKLEENEVGVGFPHRDRTWNYCCVALRPAELLACVLGEGGKFAQLPLESSHDSLGRCVSGLLLSLCIPPVVAAGTNAKFQDRGEMRLVLNSL